MENYLERENKKAFDERETKFSSREERHEIKLEKLTGTQALGEKVSF
jgi:hypothetical protein